MAKQCCTCGLVKPIDEFYKLQSKCKECQKGYNRKHRAANLEWYRNRHRNGDQKKQRERWRVSVKLYRKRHPEKVAAGSLVRLAVKLGVLVKSPCRDCGSLDVQAHHVDYNKPLEVVWLCVRCHAAEHKRIREKFPAREQREGGMAGTNAMILLE